MTDTNTKVRSLILTALMVVSVFGGTIAFAGSAAAASNINGGADNSGSITAANAVSPSEVVENSDQSYTVTFNADDISADGGTDTVTLTLPSGAELSSVGASAEESGTSDTVSVTGSAEVVNNNQITFDVSEDGSNAVDMDFQVTFDMVAPEVSSDSTFDINAAIQDSSNDDVSGTIGTLTVNNDASTDQEELVDGTTYFQGETLFYETDVAANEELEIRFDTGETDAAAAGQLVTQLTANNQGQVTVDTSTLDSDQYILVDPNGANDGDSKSGEGAANGVSFEIVQQSLTVSADDGEVVNSGDATTEDLTVETNRAGQTTYTVSGDDLSMSELESIFGTDGDTDMDGFQTTVSQDATVEADFDGISTGEYSLMFEAVDTTASDSVNVTVSEPAEGTISFEETVFTQERGDVAEITVNMENTDTATVVIGSDEVNYAAAVELVDGGVGDADGTVTLTLNTFLTNSGDGSAAFGVANSDDDDFTVSEADDYDSGFKTTNPLATADYDVVLQDGSNDVGVGTLVISERSTDSMQLWTAADLPTDADQEAVYDALNAGDITQDSTIAYQDEVVHQIGVSGIYGALTNELENEEDADDAEEALLNLVDDDVLTLSATQAGNFPNAEPLTVDFGETNTNGGLNVVADSANNTVFVALDTSDVAFDRGDNDATPSAESLYGQTFDVEFGLLADNTSLVAGDENEVVTASFSVEERTAEVNGGDDITVEAASGQTISGTTNVAPGTEVNIRARASGSNPFLKTANGVTVGADGTFSGTFDFSDVSENTTFTVTAASTGQAFANAPVEIEGTVGEAAATATPTPEPATDTPTPEPATDTPTPEPATDTPTPEPATDTPTEGGATETETSGSQPGFGGAVAIVALAGAALIALRRGN